MSNPVAVPLADRLADLRRQRDEAQLELRPQRVGDDADRATNVDAHIRLAMLERRIAEVEFELSRTDAPTAGAGTVAIGSSLTLDFGDGPEVFVMGPAELAGPDVSVVTPDSALGRVLLGVGRGFSTTYQPLPGRTARVTVLDVA